MVERIFKIIVIAP